METSTVMGYNYTDSCFYNELKNEGLVAEDRHIASVIIFSIVTILSLIGNILVVVISVFCLRLRSVISIFILNLALSDLLFTVGLVFWVCKHIWGIALGDAECKAINTFWSAGFYSSIVFLVLMSVQRYKAVVHPHPGWKKGRCIACYLICAWVVSIWAALLVTIQTVIFPESSDCFYSSKYGFSVITYKENIVFLCAFLFMGICYIRILQTILKSPRNQKHRTSGLAFLLVATFFICWAPYNIVNFLKSLTYFGIMTLKHLHYAIYVCRFLAFSRCFLSPVIYGLFGVKFRATVREIFQRRTTVNSAQI